MSTLAHISKGREVQFSPVVQGRTEQGFKLECLFPITLDQAVSNYELLEGFTKVADHLVNGLHFNDGCLEGRKVHSWAWDIYTKAKQLLEFYDCVSEQLENRVASESVKLFEKERS